MKLSELEKLSFENRMAYYDRRGITDRRIVEIETAIGCRFRRGLKALKHDFQKRTALDYLNLHIEANRYGERLGLGQKRLEFSPRIPRPEFLSGKFYLMIRTQEFVFELNPDFDVFDYGHDRNGERQVRLVKIHELKRIRVHYSRRVTDAYLAALDEQETLS